MSTRCNIVFKINGEEKIWLYHHCDGYPEGVGYWLTTFIKEQVGNHIWPIDPSTLANMLVKNYGNLDDSTYEITTGEHGDIEYLYTYDYNYTRTKDENGMWDTEYDVSLKVKGVYEDINRELWRFGQEDQQ